ncbi:DNA-directed RNA polymerase I subunit 2 [Vitis vinifera]|uniref:DNA-directed RNA polymerase n=1 Tax=Vitis vinifera TaxID=29760 RepID=A0A438DLS7_VITVI|nr:DNA-directed RNA polymerase I subunit 2 [Vitis vinifera]
MSKDEGFSLGRTKSLVLWREQDMCLLAKVRGDVYKLLRMISGEGLVVESLDNQPKDTKTVNLEVCSVEGNLGIAEFPLRRGGHPPCPALLGSVEIWNALSITAIQTKKRGAGAAIVSSQNYEVLKKRRGAGALSPSLRQGFWGCGTPQTPIVRTSAYVKYSMDEFPTGTNAIVAVLAYSGYDMEDAMILNKSSVDRGLCHGQIYQTETIDLSDENNKSDRGQRMFRRSNVDKSANSLIDSDGLPYVGQMINPNEPYCSIYNEVTSSTRATKLKGSEPVMLTMLLLMRKIKKHPQKVNIRFRRPRNPIIGDKFSSRHGQKGVCSQLWPDIDMPFSGVTGMRPDLIINPHAFPSRMTIAMLLESVAAKVLFLIMEERREENEEVLMYFLLQGGSLHGKFVDATPFSDSLRKANGEAGSESSSLVDELGSMLTSYGFNYHGVEVLYSGFYGTELTCEIFIGPVYYQRLRHMVSDKFQVTFPIYNYGVSDDLILLAVVMQVRSTGTVDQVTRQPIKGRKRGGGIRFGEMERDSMLAHGAAYLLHDRLHTCSDHHIADVCSLCGSILTTSIIQPQKRAVREIGGLPPGRAPKKVTCHACQTSKGMETVSMPYIFRFLAAELAAMNIKMTLQLSNGAGA